MPKKEIKTKKELVEAIEPKKIEPEQPKQDKDHTLVGGPTFKYGG